MGGPFVVERNAVSRETLDVRRFFAAGLRAGRTHLTAARLRRYPKRSATRLAQESRDYMQILNRSTSKAGDEFC